MSEKNEVLVRCFYDNLFTLGKMNVTALDSYLADNFVGHDLPSGLSGREGYKKFVGMLAVSFSDTTPIKFHQMIGNDDKMVVRWSSTGTHTGEFMGIPATGRRITIKGIDILCLAEDKIVDLWQEMDLLGIIRQLSAFE